MLDTSSTSGSHQHRCCACGAEGDFPYDGRFDGPACDGCHALLTIRDDIFRRKYPEHDETIRSIWRDSKDPSLARTIGRRYAQIHYWEFWDGVDRESDRSDAATSVIQRSRSKQKLLLSESDPDTEDDTAEDGDP
ncbi:MAG: hypothetical protein M1298_02190 [Chloroflexi bacterium]|nr:hypothetical protein [Chloroflexota bacterium]